MTTPERSDADRERARDAQRLDAMFRALGPAIEKGTIPAINAGLKILARRARLLGLDAPPRLPVPAPRPDSRPRRDMSRAELIERLIVLANLPEQQAAILRAAVASSDGSPPGVTSKAPKK